EAVALTEHEPALEAARRLDPEPPAGGPPRAAEGLEGPGPPLLGHPHPAGQPAGRERARPPRRAQRRPPRPLPRGGTPRRGGRARLVAAARAEYSEDAPAAQSRERTPRPAGGGWTPRVKRVLIAVDPRAPAGRAATGLGGATPPNRRGRCP